MKIDRLFHITNILLDKRSVTASWLAKELEVSTRTIYRDMDILSANGVPVYMAKGRGGGISLMENYSIDKAFFTDNEQRQILMALKGMEVTKQLNVKSSVHKLKGIFQKKNVDWIEIDFSSWEQKEEGTKFSSIKKAIEQEKVVSFQYYDSKGKHTSRQVEPMKLVFKEYNWYLYGYCLIRNDFRFFRLGRMEELEIEEMEIKAEVPEQIPLSYQKEETMTEYLLKMDNSLRFRVYDEFRKAKVQQKDGYFMVEVSLPDSPWIFGYFSGLGDGMELIKPEEKRKEFQGYLQKILKNYY